MFRGHKLREQSQINASVWPRNGFQMFRLFCKPARQQVFLLGGLMDLLYLDFKTSSGTGSASLGDSIAGVSLRFITRRGFYYSRVYKLDNCCFLWENIDF